MDDSPLARQIHDLAMARIAAVFGRGRDDLREALVFGSDLAATFKSFVHRNEFDVLSDDIHDVATPAQRKRLASEALVVDTVGDYCRFMVEAAKEVPDDVRRTLTSPLPKRLVAGHEGVAGRATRQPPSNAR